MELVEAHKRIPDVVLDLLRSDILRSFEHFGVPFDLLVGQIHGTTFAIITGNKQAPGVDLSIDMPIALQTDKLGFFVANDIGVILKRMGAFDPTTYGLLQRFEAGSMTSMR